MKKIACLSILSLQFLATKAQETLTTKEMNDVVILSERLQIPFNKQNRNIQIINAETINQLPVKSINELLQYAAGVDVRQRGPNGTQADIGIDGGTFDQTLVLLNGFKMSDPQTGHNMMNLPVPIEAIERIEIMKGAAARVYGVNALMGVINIVTKKDAVSNVIFRAYGGSSFEKDTATSKTYANFGAQAVAQFSKNNWKHLVAAGWDQGNGYRYNTAYKNSKLMYNSSGKITKNFGLELLGGIVNNKFGANAFYSAPNDKNAEEEVNTYNLALRAPINISPNWILKPNIAYRNGYDHYVFVKQNPSIYENKHRTHTIDFGLDNTIFTKYGNIGLGLNVRNEKIISTNLGDRSRINYGAFAEYQNQFFNKLDINAGLYFNQNSVFGFQVYPGIDLGYKVNNALRVYANAGMGQRLPTFTDLYYSGPNNLGNALLKPETMLSYEAGLKYQKNNFFINASVFYKNGQEFIDWIRPDTLSAWQVNNFTALNTFGLHINGNYSLKIDNKNSINLYTGYTYLDPKIGEISDESKQTWSSQYAINSLKHQWIMSVNAIIDEKWQFTLANKFVHRQNAGLAINNYARKQYNLTDLKVAYQLKTISFDASINNIFNIQYIESGVVPLPSRWFTLGATLKFNNKK